MSKYASVLRLSFKMQLVWRFDVLMTMLGAACRILAAYLLWSAAFQTREQVAGFTLPGMLSYYVVSSLLASIDKSSDVSGEVSNLIQTGRFSGHMVVPLNPLGFFGSMVFGQSMFHALFALLAALAMSLLLGIALPAFAGGAQLVMAIGMAVLGLVFMICFQYLLGILAFKFVSVLGLRFVAGHLTQFLTGAMVPLLLLPAPVLTALRALPFYYVNYLPSMLLTGHSAPGAPMGLLILAVWTLLAAAVCQLSYQRLRVRHEGVGV